MLFNNPSYILFLFFIYVIYWQFPKHLQNLFLLAASYYFYSLWSINLLVLMVGCSLSVYCIANVIAKLKSRILQKQWFIIGIIVNFSFLFVFKYYDFFVTSFTVLVNLFGFSINPAVLKLVLPVGISFYTFRLASYLIDVYKGITIPTHNLWDFLLYVSFFPQIVAGPIERASDLLSQITKKRSFDFSQAKKGLMLISYGLVKKILIADTLTIYVDTWYRHAESTSSSLLILGMVFFSIQIYCDFSGYTDVALGSGALLGFRLTENFYFPYFSTNPAEFWRRWHITLMSWFKDYLYIPLGGGRNGTGQKACNLLIVFLVSGLWHGASWNFVIWGGLNGTFVLVYTLYKKIRPKQNGNDGMLCKLFKIICLNLFIYIAWVFFRADSLGDAILIFQRIAAFQAGQFNDNPSLAKPLFLLAGFITVELVLYNIKDLQKQLLTSGYWPFCYSFIGVLLVLLVGTFRHTPFIYFQF